MTAGASEAHAWRPVVATLADAQRRLLLARATVAAAEGEPIARASLPAADARRLAALERAGLVEVVDGLVHPRDPFTGLLGSRPAAGGMDRFVVGGRIARWPRRPSDRAALLRWAAEAALAAGEELDEPTITDRLGAIHDDPALLRRDLVDAGIVSRDAAGRAYRLVR